MPVVTDVLGTTCYRCVRAGQMGSWRRRVVGGDGGIRTLDTLFKVCSFSKRVPSAARPHLLWHKDMPHAVACRKPPFQGRRFDVGRQSGAWAVLALEDEFRYGRGRFEKAQRAILASGRDK